MTKVKKSKTSKKPVHQYFWDMETYDNLFCYGFLDERNHLEMYRVNTVNDANDGKRALIRSHFDTIINRTAPYVDTTPYERHTNQVDCAYLNEKMMDKGRPTVGLKTLVGIKDGSIIESDSNKSTNSDDIYADVLNDIKDITELRDFQIKERMRNYG